MLLFVTFVQHVTALISKVQFREMNANVAQGNRGLAAEDSKLKTKINDAVQTIMRATHTKKSISEKKRGRTCPGKTEPILISAHGYEWGGGLFCGV